MREEKSKEADAVEKKILFTFLLQMFFGYVQNSYIMLSDGI